MAIDISLYDPYFHDFTTNCPYGLPHWAIYRQIAIRRVDPKIYEGFIFSGCRRAGNVIYRMACDSCRECVPIRMKVNEVKYGKTQRKVRNKNRDMRVVVRRPEFSEEKFSLYLRFINRRYPKKKTPERSNYEEFFITTCTDTWEFCYYLGDKIVGVAIVDITKNLLNGVYFFFDSLIEKRSPGVYNFIYLNEYCKEKGIPYFVMGYFIRDLPSMSYKARFNPHELLINGEWRSGQ